ncbi:Ger(x)C family spore germination protein [Geosporobacter ferrireducens]|uniref:Ger(x)C family spore germination protein n=1 Tax=Geosporobacter ferrireducens TaxID=1424294 RepID=UPI002354DC86|nr:Ger(x)C family spore germination protein [Geosporobacter ferrireducens]
MKTIKKAVIISVLCMIALVQTGCWDQKIYERIGFILQMGLELDQDERLVYTVSVPIVGPDIKGKVDVFTTSKNLLRESREKVRHVSGKAVEGGKIQHLYFSKQLAGRGINHFLEIFIRHPENPLLANIIVVDGSPKEMMELSAKFEDKPRPASYVNDLLVNARQNSYVPETRIYDFNIMAYSKTIDPVTPLIRYNEKQIETAGSALFSGDKMVGEIDTAATGMLHALMGGERKIQYMYHDKDKKEDGTKIKEGAALLIKKTKRKLNIQTEGETLKIEIKLDFKASLDEYSEAHNLDNPQAKKELEEAVAQSIQKDCMELLKYLQEIGSDPIGIGEMIRAKHNPYWKNVDWKDIYSTAIFNVEVKLIFEFYGAIK